VRRKRRRTRRSGGLCVGLAKKGEMELLFKKKPLN